MESVGHAGYKLQAVLFEAEGRIVEVVIQQVHTQAQAVIDGHGKTKLSDRRPGVRIIPGLNVRAAMGEHDLARKRAPVSLTESRADKVLVGVRGSVGIGGVIRLDKSLALVVDIRLHVELMDLLDRTAAAPWRARTSSVRLRGSAKGSFSSSFVGKSGQLSGRV